MGLKIETWTIAYRARKQGLIFEDLKDFTIINNDHMGWYADPFLFEYEGDTYLFAEYFSYRLGRGVIVCSKYDKLKGKFGKYKKIISEAYHLSYPFVFKYNGDIYMMPEANESKTLYVYKAVSFPYKWVKCSPMLDNIRLVDTTPFMVNDRIFALTYKLNNSKDFKDELILLEFDGERLRPSTQGIISTDISVARPGGKFFCIGDKIFRVSQDCKNGYGAALNIVEVKEEIECKYEEKIIKKIYPDEVEIPKNKTAEGIHTYNFSDKFEVIDLKYYKRSFIRLIYKFLS